MATNGDEARFMERAEQNGTGSPLRCQGIDAHWADHCSIPTANILYETLKSTPIDNIRPPTTIQGSRYIAGYKLGNIGNSAHDLGLVQISNQKIVIKMWDVHVYIYYTYLHCAHFTGWLKGCFISQSILCITDLTCTVPMSTQNLNSRFWLVFRHHWETKLFAVLSSGDRP